jgi:hypothetical protein
LELVSRFVDPPVVDTAFHSQIPLAMRCREPSTIHKLRH